MEDKGLREELARRTCRHAPATPQAVTSAAELATSNSCDRHLRFTHIGRNRPKSHVF